MYGERQTRGMRPEKLNVDDVVEQRFNVPRCDRSLGRDSTRTGKGQGKKKENKPFLFVTLNMDDARGAFI